METAAILDAIVDSASWITLIWARTGFLNAWAMSFISLNALTLTDKRNTASEIVFLSFSLL